MQERRKAKRFDLQLPVLIEYDDGTNLQVEKTQLENIGTGGALFPLQAAVEPGSDVELQFIDTDLKFAENLGIAKEHQEPFRYLVDCRVLRTVDSEENNNLTKVAVKFAGPLRILRSYERGKLNDTALF